jgi:hypothetical protein
MLLKRQLARSELVIDIQKKVASLLGIPLARIDEDGNCCVARPMSPT